MNKIDWLMYLIVVFLAWVEKWFVWTREERLKRKAYVRWYERHKLYHITDIDQLLYNYRKHADENGRTKVDAWFEELD